LIPKGQIHLWFAQRVSAMVLALCVVVHLLTIIYAVRNGLTAAEILGRTRGHAGWLAFYAVFVAAVALHAPIGLRTILSEAAGARSRAIDILAVAFGLLVLAMGLRAVWAVFA
jgi:fumarate reductase subunit C